MIDVAYLLFALIITTIGVMVVIYTDYLKFKKWFDQQQEATPYEIDKPIKISKRQAEIFNRSMRRIQKELKLKYK